MNKRVLLTTAALAFPLTALAQQYPASTITVIAPNAASEWDTIAARHVIGKMESILGRPLVMLNRPGALGKIGIDECARAIPNGYTLCELTFGHLNVLTADSVARGESPPFNPARNLIPIGQIAEGQYVLTVNAGLGVRTLDELIAYGKVHNLAYATHGPSSVLIGRILNAVSNVRFVEVDYGGGPGEARAMTDLLGNHVQMKVGALSLSKQAIDDGRLIALGVFGGSGRSRFLSHVPTLEEQGVLGLHLVRSWNSLWAPTGTSQAVVEALSSALVRALQEPQVIRSFDSMMIESGSGTPEQLQSLLHDALPLAAFMREKGIKLFDK